MLTIERQQRVQETAREFAGRLRQAMAHGTVGQQEGAAGLVAVVGCAVRRRAMGSLDDISDEVGLGLAALDAFADSKRGAVIEDAAKILGDLFDWEYRPATLTLAAVTGVGRGGWWDYLTCRAETLDGQNEAAQ